MLPKPCISGGIRCVQNGFRIQIVSAVKQHKLPLFLPEIVGQRSVCDHVAGECKCLAVFFAVRAHQSNILRQSCAVGKIAVQKSLEQGMLLLSQETMIWCSPKFLRRCTSNFNIQVEFLFHGWLPEESAPDQEQGFRYRQSHKTERKFFPGGSSQQADSWEMFCEKACNPLSRLSAAVRSFRCRPL